MWFCFVPDILYFCFVWCSKFYVRFIRLNMKRCKWTEVLLSVFFLLLSDPLGAQTSEIVWVSRSEYLKNEGHFYVGKTPVSEDNIRIKDLKQSDWKKKITSGTEIFRITEKMFYEYPTPKKVHIISNPDTYIIVPEGMEQEKKKISRVEFNQLPEEKKNIILTNPDIEIVD